MNRAQLVDQLEATAWALAGRGFDVRPVIIEEPASIDEVVGLEALIGFAHPAAYRDALLNISRHVEFRWFAPEPVNSCLPFCWGSILI
ncbi:MAG: hypothetical protein ACKVWR_18185 [Acidimicrobiales bacterium]